MTVELFSVGFGGFNRQSLQDVRFQKQTFGFQLGGFFPDAGPYGRQEQRHAVRRSTKRGEIIRKTKHFAFGLPVELKT